MTTLRNIFADTRKRWIATVAIGLVLVVGVYGAESWVMGKIKAAYSIANSARFIQGTPDYLSRTPASAGSQTTWTWSGWVKKTTVGDGNTHILFAVRNAGPTVYGYLGFTADAVDFSDGPSGARITSTSLYRDPAAWIHVVYVADTTNAVAADRMRIYVNGVRVTSFSTQTNPSQNASLSFNTAQPTGIGIYPTSLTSAFDGYMADVYFIDGAALSPTCFGQTDANGYWRPVPYSTGTPCAAYGTNGFHLDFSNGSSLGTDVSGQGNNFTPSGLAATDQVIDTPTNGFATLSSINRSTGSSAAVLVNGNLKDTAPSGVNGTPGAYAMSTATIAPTTGKWYFEVSASQVSGSAGNANAGVSNNINYNYNGTNYYQGSITSTAGKNLTTGGTDMFAFDVDAGKIWTGTNGVWDSGNPATGTGGTSISAVNGLLPYVVAYNDTVNRVDVTANFGQGGQSGLTYDSASGGNFKYTPPSGFKALATFNLPVPSVTVPQQYFQSTIYTGQGITSSVSNATKVIFLTTQGPATWVVPNDWNSASNTIEVIGGGGGGGNGGTTGSGSGGGGGEYRKITNLQLAAGASVTYSAGAGGGVAQAGNDSWFNGSGCASASVCAKGGGAGTSNALTTVGGTGGTGGIGGIGYNGGTGGGPGTGGNAGAGGGGAAGPNSTGGTGANVPNVGSSGGAGGGGDGGGTSGSAPSSTTGGNGGNNYAGTGGTAGATNTNNATAATNGGGGGGGGTQGRGANGGAGVEWVQTSDGSKAGSGGGGGGAGQQTGAAPVSGGNGGLYGGGGGGGSYNSSNNVGGSGAQGIVVITYTPTYAGFTPGLVWIKDRTSAYAHGLFDSLRSGYLLWASNLSQAEGSTTAVTALNSNGFTLSTDSTVNKSGDSYVAWMWKKGATPGVDIVTYTGTGNATTISHNLGKAPDMIIIKRRDTTGDAYVYHTSLGNTKYVPLDSTTGSPVTDSTVWNNTSPTASVFSVGTNSAVNASGGTYVAYLFASTTGFSSFGSYTGNASTDGPFVYTGFKPRYMFLLNTSSGSGNFTVVDTARDTYNPAGNRILLNLNNAEDQPGALVDLLSNGFKIRNSGSQLNGTGNTFIYAAFADIPFQQSAQPYNLTIASSTRFTPANTNYLSRTPASAGSRTTWTFSAWVKPSSISSNSGLLSAKLTKDDTSYIAIGPNGAGLEISVHDRPGGVDGLSLNTNMQLRDPAAWVHIVVDYDTTQSVSTNRARVYVNGVQVTSFRVASYPAQNYASGYINSTQTQYVGVWQDVATNYLDGYLSDVYFIDGQALSPTSFGEYDTNGYWRPKAYTGTYGTNGFHLPLTNPTGPGTDTSGNGNNFTGNNLSATDAVSDTPTGSFATISPLGDAVTTMGSSMTLSSGALTHTSTAASGAVANTTIPVGKWYWEDKATALVAFAVGLAKDTRDLTTNPGVDLTNEWVMYMNPNANLVTNGSNPCSTGAASAGDVFQVAVDNTTPGSTKLWIGRNNSWYDSSCGTTGNPATGSNPTATISYLTLYPFFAGGSGTNTGVVDFGQGGQSGLTYDSASGGYFKFTPPSGFKALSTANLPTPTVTKPASYFNAVTYTGVGGIQAIAASSTTTTFDTAGANSYTVPNYTTLTVEIWGAGGGGGGVGPTSGNNGTDGTATTFSTLTAGGGTHGNGSTSGTASSGSGGSASGGDINTTGNNGSASSLSSTGAGAPNGGGNITSSGNQNGQAGTTPGGGGSGGSWPGTGSPTGGGGGSGGYVRKTYYAGAFTPGQVINFTVGTGGPGGTGDAWAGGTGANGRVKITYTDTTNGFQPDLVWIKDRTSAYPHAIADSSRVGYPSWASNLSAAEASTTGLLSFLTSGFTLGTDPTFNKIGDNYVAWMWKKAPTQDGVDIVTYTGTGVATTIAHSLGKAPDMIIVKRRDSTGDGVVYHTSLGNTKYLQLDSTAAATVDSTMWNNTSPTASVFSVGTNSAVNANGGSYVAYLFASTTGFSSFGTYTGNASTDGPFIYTGFKPRYVLLRSTAASQDWYVLDTARDTYNPAQSRLVPDLTNADLNDSSYATDMLSNGFKLRNTNNALNQSSQAFIYAAFADVPYKYSASTASLTFVQAVAFLLGMTF